MQISMGIVLFGLLLELVKFGETYKMFKPFKPYKHYYSQPWRPPRWHSFPKPLKPYRPKGRPQKYYFYEPEYHRYAPSYEDTVDSHDTGKPYVIIIQLSQKKENTHRSYKRHHITDDPLNDYIDNDDDEVKVYQLDNKAVQIKVNDRLSVLTS
ncbi:uncharacterized protein LOC109852426 [Pseudomyrmex gracilis]|uniref:uncharacterized protein LOC109852426 n=1 Tax=Pseudomyrmex gracilis TaxID=219809 RepID=UPI000994D33E|nr:uncharacterized protein LOC109852426 [Pseudomyrmex gracilis]